MEFEELKIVQTLLHSRIYWFGKPFERQYTNVCSKASDVFYHMGNNR